MVDLTSVPRSPGVYLFEDSSGVILYVGKAQDLKKRVSSYFQKKNLDEKTLAMVGKIASVDTIVTRNENEALILESNLIKRHQPRYNINLRDSKRYAYIMLSKEEFPRLLMARRKVEDGTYFGPFVSAERRDELLRFASNVFKLRTCKKLPKRVCLRYHMNLCTAPCIQNVSREQYALQVSDAKTVLSGGNAGLLIDLKVRMAKHARHHEFEQAKILRDQIAAIESLNVKQAAETQRKYDQDIVNYMVDGGTVHLSVFNAYQGVLSSKDEYDFEFREDFLAEFILQYYSDEAIPAEIIVPEKLPAELAAYLSEKRGSKVRVTLPASGEKKDLLELVRRNVEKDFMESELAMQDLQDKLGLESPPKVIECFDISHLAGTNPVGSMVRFVDGKPDKSGYRRFKIKTVEGVDDFAMMAEIVRRRYSHVKEDGMQAPDLIVLDGGAGQLSAASSELEKLGLDVPTIALAKKLEEIYFPENPQPRRFDLKSRGMKLLQNVRDEAHRFAVTYHKLLRTKRIFNKK